MAIDNITFYDANGNENPKVYKLYCEATASIIDTDTPGGDPIIYLDDGTKAAVLLSEGAYSTLVRGEREIRSSYEEFSERVWWNRHQVWLQELADRGAPLTKTERPIFDRARKEAKRIEAKYDRSDLELDDFEWGLLSGRLSALSWVLGDSWEDSLDT